MIHSAPRSHAYTPDTIARAIRVVSRIQSCAKCSRTMFRSYSQAGWGFKTCEHRPCGHEWWYLALPPEAFGGYLAGILGEPAAAVVLHAGWPATRGVDPPSLWAVELNPSDDAMWVQIAVRPRERHLYLTERNAERLVTALLAA